MKIQYLILWVKHFKPRKRTMEITIQRNELSIVLVAEGFRKTYFDKEGN